MRAYTIRRLLLTIPTMLILTILVFLSVRFIPGDIVDFFADTSFGQGKVVDEEALRRMLGLDVPVHVQYGRWMGDIFLHGTLGRSLWGVAAVEEKILGRLPVTIELGVLSIVILYPAIWWGWSPSVELIPFTEDPLGNLGMFIIPAVILGTALSAATMRMTRTMMLEVLRQDYIRTAWSKGLNERVVVLRHAIKNALIPIVTLIGLQLPILVGGSVIMENIFNLPGLGRLMVKALSQRDYPVVSGVNLVFATAVLGANLMIDLIYPYLDPRVRYS